jgi:hypothetical protein
VGDEKYRKQRNWGARILEYEHKGMQVVFLENEKLKVGVLVDKGTDVIEFNHKPTDTDFVWLAPGGVRNPTSYLSTAPDPLATFLDYYPGGWQEIFPTVEPLLHISALDSASMARSATCPGITT